MAVKFLKLSGSSFDIGYQHGAGARQEIQSAYEYYMTFWSTGSSSSEKTILHTAMSFLPFLDQRLLEELEGVAAGSELELAKIIALNCRWELNYAYMPDMQGWLGAGCTAFALTPEITRNHHTYLGQNWDYKLPLQEQCIILSIQQENRPSLILITEAGIIGHKGFSSSGIAIAVNFIRLTKDTSRPGTPFLMKMRQILEQPTLDECIRFLERNPGPNSGNVLIACRDGRAVDAELNPQSMSVIHPDKGILVHSNHFQRPPKGEKDVGCTALPDTFARTKQLYWHLSHCRANSDAEAIEIGLRDHAGFPDSICRHQNTSIPPENHWETLLSFYFDINAQELKLTIGPPCHSSYISIQGFDDPIFKQAAEKG
jgi:isopenicillin-N N-acyltransferase-like protein